MELNAVTSQSGSIQYDEESVLVGAVPARQCPDAPEVFFSTLQNDFGISCQEDGRRRRWVAGWYLGILACVILGVYSTYTHVHSVRKGANSVFFWSDILLWTAVVCGVAAHLKKITYNIKAFETVCAETFFAPTLKDSLSNLYPIHMQKTAERKMQSYRRLGAATMFSLFTMIPNIYKTEAKNDQLSGVPAFLVATAAEGVDLPESFISNVDGLEWMELKMAKPQVFESVKMRELARYVEEQLSLFEKEVEGVDKELQSAWGNVMLSFKNKLLYILVPVNLFVNTVFAFQAYNKLLGIIWASLLLSFVSELQDIFFKIAMPAGIVRTHRALPESCRTSRWRYLRYFVYIFVSLFSFTGAYYDVMISIGKWTDSEWIIVLAVANSLYNTLYDIYILRNTFDLVWERISPSTSEKYVQLKVLEVLRKKILALAP